MLNKLSKSLLSAAIAAGAAAGSYAYAQNQPAGQAAQQGQKKGPQWKDTAEYELYSAFTKETDGNKKLAILDQWKQKYPESEFKEPRLQAYIITYQQLGKADKILEVAKEWLALNPKALIPMNMVAAIVPASPNPTPEAIDMAEKSAQGLLNAEKPAEVGDADWQKAKAEADKLAHRTLGWAAMQRKNNDQAVAELTKTIQLNPNDAEAAYWLAGLYRAQKDPEKQSAALYLYARAAAYTGPGALAPQTRAQIDQYLTKAYTSYHGSNEGLPQLKQQAASQPLPPAGFRVKTGAEIEVESANKLAQENPQLAIWKNTKTELTGANSQQFFEGTVKGSAFPKMKGTLISAKPEASPKELTLGIENPTTPEVTLKLDAAMRGKADPGTVLEFEGVPTEFTKEPFNLTFEVEKAKVSGWPAPAAPAKPVGKKKAAGGARKKK